MPAAQSAPRTPNLLCKVVGPSRRDLAQDFRVGCGSSWTSSGRPKCPAHPSHPYTPLSLSRERWAGAKGERGRGGEINKNYGVPPTRALTPTGCGGGRSFATMGMHASRHYGSPQPRGPLPDRSGIKCRPRGERSLIPNQPGRGPLCVMGTRSVVMRACPWLRVPS